MFRKGVDALLRIGIAVLIFAFIWTVGGAIQEPHITVAGDVAPNFAITTDRSSRVTLVDFRGRVLVLNFWASWCGPCIEETPSLNEFQRALQGWGVAVLGINIDREEQAYRGFLKRFAVEFETARDPERKISSEYGTFQIPESYIIDKTGRVAAKVISNQNWMDPKVISAVKALL